MGWNRRHLLEIASFCGAVVLAAACGKSGPQGSGGPEHAAPGAHPAAQGPNAPGAPATGAAGPVEANQGAPVHASEPIAVLDALYEVEPPRSTATDEVALPFVEVTPTAPPPPPARADGAPGVAPSAPGAPRPPPVAAAVVQWTRATIVIGRRQWFLDGKPMGAVRCTAPAGLCDAAALQGPSGKQVLDLGEGAVDAAVAELAQAAAGLRDRDVVVVADRRIAAGAVERTRRTLAGVGARPQLAVASYFGLLVDPLGPAGTPLPTGTPPVAASPAPGTPADPGANDGVPDDLTAVTVRVGARGMALELVRPVGEPVTPELLGNVLETLNAWAQRLRVAAPGVETATVRATVDAPWDEVVRAIDALRDTCASAAKGTPCHVRSRLFRVSVDVSSVPANAPAPNAPGSPTPSSPLHAVP